MGEFEYFIVLLVGIEFIKFVNSAGCYIHRHRFDLLQPPSIIGAAHSISYAGGGIRAFAKIETQFSLTWVVTQIRSAGLAFEHSYRAPNSNDRNKRLI